MGAGEETSTAEAHYSYRGNGVYTIEDVPGSGDVPATVNLSGYMDQNGYWSTSFRWTTDYRRQGTEWEVSGTASGLGHLSAHLGPRSVPVPFQPKGDSPRERPPIPGGIH